MNLFRYFLILLAASVAVSNAYESYSAFDWDTLLLAFGFGFIAFGAWSNNTLVWPYEVAADYAPRISESASQAIFNCGQMLVCLGVVTKVVQAFLA